MENFKVPSKRHCEYIYLRCYFKEIKDIFDRYIKENDTVFDIGCGNKPMEQYIRTLIKNDRAESYVGCDVVQSSARKVDIVCDATDIPEKSSAYDIVVCTQVVEHVFDHAKVFEEAFRLLKPGGFFIVSGPFVWPVHEAPYDYFRFTRYGFQELLKKTGFIVGEERACGGKFAVLGQILLLTLGSGGNIVKRIIIFVIRFLCNHTVPFLDNTFKSGRLTLNYVFVGEKPSASE
ncbi:MAG: class I SAM-dependent methyltransferase [Bacteroidales bacterium]|nr:class I SAM-dependent methyltransferase [Bacteroidales bacterium]